MTQHERGDSGSKVWREWHLERERARRTEFGLSVFGNIEIEKYDLDTADIDGESNPDTYTTEPYGDDEESYDIRDHPQF